MFVTACGSSFASSPAKFWFLAFKWLFGGWCVLPGFLWPESSGGFVFSLYPWRPRRCACVLTSGFALKAARIVGSICGAIAGVDIGWAVDRVVHATHPCGVSIDAFDALAFDFSAVLRTFGAAACPPRMFTFLFGIAISLARLVPSLHGVAGFITTTQRKQRKAANRCQK